MFVTFRTMGMAEEVHDGFKHSVFQCGYLPPEPSVSTQELHPEKWNVSYAAPPEDIYFENLSSGKRYLTLKMIIINIALFIFAIFFSTPEYFVTQTDHILAYFGHEMKLPPVIMDFLPTLMLVAFTSLMPLVGEY
jgi:hypothetical protein